MRVQGTIVRLICVHIMPQPRASILDNKCAVDSMGVRRVKSACGDLCLVANFLMMCIEIRFSIALRNNSISSIFQISSSRSKVAAGRIKKESTSSASMYDVITCTLAKCRIISSQLNPYAWPHTRTLPCLVPGTELMHCKTSQRSPAARAGKLLRSPPLCASTTFKSCQDDASGPAPAQVQARACSR
jgi:hypothetical protein